MSGAVAAAAAAQRQRIEHEEEEMTTYGSDDLSRDWEFKIVRANTPLFGNPKHFNRLLEEEARAGWSMVEKFDNSRIRFKRPRAARTNDSNLAPGIDPYRVQYGVSTPAFVALLITAIFALVGGIMFVIYLLVSAFGK
jgi:hypothetical protein